MNHLERRPLGNLIGITRHGHDHIVWRSPFKNFAQLKQMAVDPDKHYDTDEEYFLDFQRHHTNTVYTYSDATGFTYLVEYNWDVLWDHYPALIEPTTEEINEIAAMEVAFN
jgi:hypothetical protein